MGFKQSKFSMHHQNEFGFLLTLTLLTHIHVLQIHDSRPLSVKTYKSLGDKIISDQHFTARDFLEAVR